MVRCRTAVLVVLCGVCIGLASEARAQEGDVPAVDARIVTSASLLETAQAPDAPVVRALPASVAAPAEKPRSPLFMFLYGFTVGTQATDVHSTRRALEAGAFETNPFMTAISSHTSRLILVKGGMTVGTILVTERIARHHKATAILTLIAMNTAYAYVAYHNYEISRRIR